jgi:DNA invertase Pin-like site-specific DNA recombinase
MMIGYARVSTKDQHLRMQMDDLQMAGCDKIYTEVASGSKNDRPVLAELLSFIKEGDVLVIWKLDRLGRSLQHLIKTIAFLLGKGVGFKSINDPIDTTTAQGRLIFNIFASLSEFERELIVERTKAGLRAARARGKVGGRPKGLGKEEEKTSYAAAALYQEGTLSSGEICKRLGIARSTLYVYLHIRGVEIGNKKGARVEGKDGG